MEFKEKVEYIKTHKNIDPSKFNTVGEITQIIDMLNAEKDKYLDDLLKDTVSETVSYGGAIPQKVVLQELEHRKKKHIANYKKEQHLIKA